MLSQKGWIHFHKIDPDGFAGLVSMYHATEHYKRSNAAAQKRWRETHPEKHRAYQREYYRRNYAKSKT